MKNLLVLLSLFVILGFVNSSSAYAEVKYQLCFGNTKVQDPFYTRNCMINKIIITRNPLSNNLINIEMTSSYKDPKLTNKKVVCQIFRPIVYASGSLSSVGELTLGGEISHGYYLYGPDIKPYVSIHLSFKCTDKEVKSYKPIPDKDKFTDEYRLKVYNKEGNDFASYDAIRKRVNTIVPITYTLIQLLTKKQDKYEILLGKAF